jgi:hypothetical protein
MNCETQQWCSHDFSINKAYWSNQTEIDEVAVRRENLGLVFKAFSKHNVAVWLQGRTLKGAFETKGFLPDHDDDVGVWVEDLSSIRASVLPDLVGEGFRVIRDVPGILSIIRKDRYVDVCLFRRVGARKVGYAEKIFPSKYFERLLPANFLDIPAFYPNDTANLLRVMYGWRSRLDKGKTRMRKMTNSADRSDLFRRIFRKALENTPHLGRLLISCFSKYFGVSYVEIRRDEFTGMLIESSDSYNWKWRKPHLDVVTNTGKCTRVGDIVDYFSREDVLEKVKNNIIDTNTTRPFRNPINYQKEFWQNGNNYFFYCIYYGFKKGVVPYLRANEYIEGGGGPMLYSSEYFGGLRDCEDFEVSRMLKKHPVEITNGAFTGGKHRAFAMIGRLVRTQTYLPFWAIVIDEGSS